MNVHQSGTDIAEPAPPPSPRELAPIMEGERIVTLDVLRGVALLGILLVNMQAFALPLAKFYGTPLLMDAPLSSRIAWAFVHVFCQAKFISLFSLLFGIGLAVGLARARMAGRPFTGPYLRRLLVLGVIGALHGFLLWYGDILLIYALLGFPLLFLARLRPRTLFTIAAALIAFGMFVGGFFNFLQSFGQSMHLEDARHAVVEPDVEEPQEHDAWEAMWAADLDIMSPIWMEAETRAFRDGPWSEAMTFRAMTMAFNLGMIFVLGWGVLGLFLLGAALMKIGFFQPRNRRWHIAATIIGFSVGLPLEILSAWMIVSAGFVWDFTFATGLLVHDVARLFMLAGYVGGVTLLVSSGALGWIGSALAAVGRMALTNYLLQTVIATAITYHWGLGLFGEISRPQQIALALVIFLAQVAISALWLSSFRMGPLEWLWRAATYGRWPALVR